jgi:hypothetical protein
MALHAIALGLLIACTGRADMAASGSATAASYHASRFVRERYPLGEYRQSCRTRLRDGFLVTLRLAPAEDIAHVGYPEWPLIAVHDSGFAAEAIVLMSPADADRGARPATPASLDSAGLVSLASAVAPAGAVLHCVLMIDRGAFIQFVPPGVSARTTPLGGVGVLVARDGRRGGVTHF